MAEVCDERTSPLKPKSGLSGTGGPVKPGFGRDGRGGWPTQARFWLEWGSSTAGQSLPELFRVFVSLFRLDLQSSVTACCIMDQLQHPPTLNFAKSAKFRMGQQAKF